MRKAHSIYLDNNLETKVQGSKLGFLGGGAIPITRGHLTRSNVKTEFQTQKFFLGNEHIRHKIKKN